MTTEKRLIDANEAYETIIDLSGQADTKSAYAAFWKAGKEIQKLPTVDVVEVVHGWWIVEKRHTVSQNPYMDDNYHAHATCSECGFCIHSENASFGYPKLNTTNYCPNCGAKMDGGINK